MRRKLAERPKRKPLGYTPRAVVKFHDGVLLPYDDARVLVHLDVQDDREWRQLRRRFPAASIRTMFTAVSPERIRELVGQAVHRDPSYRPPNFLTYFMIEGDADFAVVVETMRGWASMVANAWIDPPAVEPAVQPGNDPKFLFQGYLKAAPQGIDAKFAWQVAGGDGKAQDFIDLERGWTLNHEDLALHGAAKLHGKIAAEARPHGTSVLGVVCAVDNAVGGVGIAPKVGSVQVVSHHGSNRPDAILAAIDELPFGGVLLLEAQLIDMSIGDQEFGPLPIETREAEFDMIRLATASGITVIECAGNGAENLDKFKNESGEFILKRTSRDFRDSGATMVGAATSTAPHSREQVSNFGSRIDCYAWGENVHTATTTEAAPFATDRYTSSFSGTSAAGAIIAGAALAVQGIAEASPRGRLNAFEMRALLSDPDTGTRSKNPGADRIGVMPNLRKIITNNALGVIQALPSKKNKKKKKQTQKRKKRPAKTAKRKRKTKQKKRKRTRRRRS